MRGSRPGISPDRVSDRTGSLLADHRQHLAHCTMGPAFQQEPLFSSSIFWKFLSIVLNCPRISPDRVSDRTSSLGILVVAKPLIAMVSSKKWPSLKSTRIWRWWAILLHCYITATRKGRWWAAGKLILWQHPPAEGGTNLLSTFYPSFCQFF